MARILIINADDFGLNASATHAIVETHLAGNVTSTTLMVNTPYTQEAVALAKTLPKLGVGLHFNLTWGEPISSPSTVPTLVDQRGRFYSRQALAKRIFMNRVAQQDVERELHAQFARMKTLGLSPTHLDSHQHVHGFGVIFDAVAKLCSQHRIAMRVPWVEDFGVHSGAARTIRRAVLKYLLKKSTQRWQGKVSWNHCLMSVFDLLRAGELPDERHYVRLLELAHGNTVELMVHPVLEAHAMTGYTSIGAISEAEYKYLRTNTLGKLAQEQGFVLAHYGALNPQTAA